MTTKKTKVLIEAEVTYSTDFETLRQCGFDCEHRTGIVCKLFHHFDCPNRCAECFEAENRNRDYHAGLLK
jgi:hypothetical protein